MTAYALSPSSVETQLALYVPAQAIAANMQRAAQTPTAVRLDLDFLNCRLADGDFSDVAAARQLFVETSDPVRRAGQFAIRPVFEQGVLSTTSLVDDVDPFASLNLAEKALETESVRAVLRALGYLSMPSDIRKGTYYTATWYADPSGRAMVLRATKMVDVLAKRQTVIHAEGLSAEVEQRLALEIHSDIAVADPDALSLVLEESLTRSILKSEPTADLSAVLDEFIDERQASFIPIASIFTARQSWWQELPALAETM